MSSRTRILVPLIAAVGVVAATTVAMLATPREDPSEPRAAATDKPKPDPSDTSMPAPVRAEADQSLRFLEGEGAALLVMHRAAVRLAGGLTAAECDRLADTLDRDAPPDQMVLLAAGLDDEPLQAAFIDEVHSLGATLTACPKGTPVSEDVAPLGEITPLVKERLDALAAAR